MQCSIGLSASSVGEAPELVMEAMELSKMMAKHNFRSWCMKIDTIISKYGFAYIMEDMKITKFNTSSGS